MIAGLNIVMDSLSENAYPNETPNQFQSDTLKVSTEKMTVGKFCDDLFTTEKYFFDDAFDLIATNSSSDGEQQSYDG
jgi:hypothetical protein